MKLREISESDVRQGKIWRVLSSETDDWLDWEITEAQRVNVEDVIVHSAVIVDSDEVIPTLVTKYYEDGGEVGDYAVFLNSEWKALDQGMLRGSTEGAFLSRISTLDIHEYQKGSFDNRPQHYAKFRHYASQIGKSGNLVPFPTLDPQIPSKYLRMSPQERVEYIRATIRMVERLHREGKISKGNRLVGRVSLVVESLKQHPDNHPLLKSLLSDEDAHVIAWMKYQLFDLFPEECVELIRLAAKKDTLEALGAQAWLRDHGFSERRFSLRTLFRRILAKRT